MPEKYKLELPGLNEIDTIMAEQLGLQESEITDESNLVNDLGADSLDEVEVIMAIESLFGIEIPDEVTNSFKTVSDVKNYVESVIK